LLALVDSNQHHRQQSRTPPFPARQITREQ
jgi:hypothetical protein